MTRYVCAFYEIDRAYGGPEEGGWWYDTGKMIRMVKICKSQDVALNWMLRANSLLSHLQRHQRPVSSAAYDGGIFRAEIFSDIAPQQYPETRPHYE